MNYPVPVSCPSVLWPCLLAQSGEASAHAAELIKTAVYLGMGLVLLALAGKAVYRTVSARYGGGDESPTLFSLSQLRRLHSEGQLSDEEFARLKAAVIGAAIEKSPPLQLDATAPVPPVNSDTAGTQGRTRPVTRPGPGGLPCQIIPDGQADFERGPQNNADSQGEVGIQVP